MKNSIVSKIMLLILFSGLVTFAFEFDVKPAKAWTGTVYIRADGSIDPPDAPIITSDNMTYVLTDNIVTSGNGIVVERNNIIIDGAGLTLQGPGTGAYVQGVDLTERTNVTVRNLNIIGFHASIFMMESYNCKIHSNNLLNNSNCGIGLAHSDNNIIFNNNITNNPTGIIVYNSMNNKIYHNNFFNNALQAASKDSVNYWDNGYPSGGNYWSDYRGTDEKSGPDQNQPESDGIGDTPYSIYSEGPTALDNYPLMNVVPEFSLTLMLLEFLILVTVTLVFIQKRQNRKTKP